MRPVLVGIQEESTLDKTTNPPHTRPSRDAGLNFPPARRNPALKASASAFAGDRQPSLEGHQLRDVRNDTKSRAFCGPTAVATIVDEPVSVVRDAFRLARCGASWVNYDRAPAIMGTTHREVEAVLQAFGFIGHWQTVRGNPTLAAFLEERNGDLRTHPTIIEVTGHWVAVCGWQFCDTFSKGQVVEAENAPRRRARVKRVFVLTGRVPPSAIPRKDYSAAAARAAAGQKARSAYTRFLAGFGARHEIDRDHPGYQTITVTFPDGTKIGMHFDDWKQALEDLEYVLTDPEDDEIEEIEDGFRWYGF